MNWAGWLALGLMAGTTIGVLIMCIMFVAKGRGDQQERGDA